MLSNKLYDWLKWFAIAGLHALGVAYNALAGIWGLPYGQAIPETFDIIGVLLAAFLAWQSYDYSKKFDVISTEKTLAEAQTSFNADDLTVLVEDGEIENVYDENNQAE